MVTHDQEEAMTMADRIAVMYRGKLMAIVSADTPRSRLGLLMAGVADSEGTAA